VLRNRALQIDIYITLHYITSDKF